MPILFIFQVPAKQLNRGKGHIYGKPYKHNIPCTLHVDSVRQRELRGPEFVEAASKAEGGDRAGERGGP